MKDNNHTGTINDEVLKDIGSLESATEELNDYDLEGEELDVEEMGNILTIIGKALLGILK